MILISGSAKLALALVLIAAPARAAVAMQQDDPAAPLRRLAATTALAAQEYALGVEDGKVVLAAEVEETELFLAEARRTAAKLPAAERAIAEAELDTAIALVARRGAPDSLAMRVGRLSSELARRLGVTLDEIPAATPSLARGAEVYQASCAGCHGVAGRGDGPAGEGLDPAPANLADAAALRDVTPLDFYRRVTIGVAGTAMPAYEHTLPAADRWAVAVYASLLRLPAPASHADVPAALRPFAATAKLSDQALVDAVGGTDEREALALVAAVRSLQPDPAAADAGPVFDEVRRRVDSAAALARAGRAEEAGTAALDAYMTFEQVERDVRAKNAPLADELEAAFATLRTTAAAGAAAGEVNRARGELLAGLERAERTVAASLSPFNLFLQSFVLLLREGLEAILIVGALLTFLVKTGAGHRKRDIHLGIGGAVVASLLTAVLIETIFRISAAQQEALEGVTMLLATVVLFYVSYWLLSKMEVVKWTSFVKSRVAGAVTSGSSFALASAAFLAVYREGFETILFYKALFAAGGGSTLPVFAGMAAGTVVLVITYLAINRFGVKLPLKPFFAVTSAFLYYMAFVFAGQGVAELQEGGYLPTTVIGLEPRIPALGIYPTVETLAAQGVLVLLALVALVWVFLVEPRRLRVTSVMVPEPASGAAPAGAASVRAAASVPFSGELTRELLRSLERMEADLAEMRSEVERMKDHLVAAPREQSSRLH